MLDALTMTNQKTTRRKYTEEFNREAMALVTEAAWSLGINANQLHRWKQKVSLNQFVRVNAKMRARCR